jgi:hypothetical protein
MFSLDRFYNILHDNLISKLLNGKSTYFYPFGTYQQSITLADNFNIPWPKNNVSFHKADRPFFHCYFADQEPFYQSTETILKNVLIYPDHIMPESRINILAISEKSKVKTDFVKSNKYYDWYYFFHGFAALDWYRDFQYVNQSSFNRFDKVFICYNHLTSNLRSYRLHLVSNLINQDVTKYGLVSLFPEGWRGTIRDPEIPLDNRARVKIHNALKNVKQPLIIDTSTPSGTLSANIDFENAVSALFHVVTETVYFDNKLHLTEKVFKPIVCQRPFFLVAAPGNLAYLKSYGFRTFDQWIDESYDEETDHYVRIEKITAEIARLCAMSPATLKQIHKEMQEVLEYNFNHFYTTFKDRIVDELVDNFSDVLKQINHGRIPGNHSRYHQRFELEPDYLGEVKKRLKQ